MTEAHNIDCMAAMSQMKDNEFELAIVDPPYGIGAAKDTRFNKMFKDNTKGGKNYFMSGNYKVSDWDNSTPSGEYFEELLRVSKHYIIWGANHYNFNLSGPGWVVWDKLNGESNLSDCELAASNYNKAVRKFELLWNGFQRGEKTIRIHPTQKPIALYKWLLKNYAKEGDRILDTHLGSGSSRIAAHDMGFDFVGYEIDKDYFDAQELRFENHIKQGSLFDAKEMY